MRETVDFGIDLGTTNSAIAVAEHGEVRVIKNNEGWDCTPSAVWMPKPDVVHVGRRARERTPTDPEDAHFEFKLEMGVAGARRAFRKAGVSLTPEELSAEVLKSLRGDAAHGSGVPPEAAVITVPAAFALHQTAATSRAAELAGLGSACPLVQEPTAAAYAYGHQDASEHGYWMVFDFGGGTFDAAVVSRQDGELRVLNHAGDPYLGGKLIDRAIVDRLLVPAVVRELGLSDFTRENDAWRGNFARLKLAAEDAKIQLSRQESFTVDADLDVGGGQLEPFDCTLTRAEVDGLAAPYYARAVNLCREALTEGGLQPDAVDRLLLVGGSTLAPGLREWVADPEHGLGIEVDHSQDPTTVVARGAAIFAGTVRAERKAAPPVRAGEFTVELSYEPRVTTTTPPVGGILLGAGETDWTRYSVVLANEQGRPPFRSPRIAVGADGRFVTEVSVDPHTSSRFTVELTDADGVAQQLTPDTLTFTHGDLEPARAVLTQSLGIGLADGAFRPLLGKGTALPTQVTRNYKSSIALRRSDPDSVVRIPLAEGEQPRVERNNKVGQVEIRPRDVRIDLPAYSDIEVTFEVDTSRRVTVIADVLAADAQFEAEINLSDVRPPDQAELRASLGRAERRLALLRESAGTLRQPAALARLGRLDEELVLDGLREHVAAAGREVDAAGAAENLLHYLESEIDAVEQDLDRPAHQQELTDILTACRMLAGQGGDAEVQRELAGLEAQAEQAAREDDRAAMRRASEDARELYVDLLRAVGQFEKVVFHALREMRADMSPARTADELLARGRRAVRSGDDRALAEVNHALRGLLPPGLSGAGAAAGLVGGVVQQEG